MTLRRLVAGASSATLLVAALSLAPVSSAVADEPTDPVAVTADPADSTVPEDSADAAVPTLSVPELVELGIGGQPVPLDIAVEGTADGDSVEVDLVLADAPAEVVSLETAGADGTWAPVELTSRERPEDDTVDTLASFAFEPGVTEVRLGVPFNISLEEELTGAAAAVAEERDAGSLRELLAGRSAQVRRDGLSAAAGSRTAAATAAADDEVPEVVALDLTTSLTVNDAPAGEELMSTVRILAPSVTVDGELPEVVEAGESFPLRIKIDNRTGSTYTAGPTYDSTLESVIVGVFLSEDDMEFLEDPEAEDEEGFPGLDPDEVAISCAPVGGQLRPVTPASSELLELIGDPLLVGTASLADDASASFDCEVTVTEVARDGILLLMPEATVGTYGLPVGQLTETGGEFLGVEVVGAQVAGPTTEPTAPPQARPVTPTGTGTLPETGSASGSLAAYGLTLVLTGVGVLLATRRRRTA